MTVSLPYEPGRAAFASLERTADDLAGLAAGRIEELPPRATATTPTRRSRTSSARCSRTRRPPAPPSRARSAFSRAPAHARTLELVARRDPRAAARGHARPRRSLVVCPSLERCARAARGVARRARRPVRARGHASGSARRRSGTRCSRCSATPGSAAAGASCSRSCARRTPGSPRAHVDFLEGRLRGRGVHTPERVEEETVKLRGQPLPVARRAALARRRRSPRSARSPARCSGPRTGSRRRRRREAVAARPARLRGRPAAARRARGLARASAATLSPEELAGALERAQVRARVRRRGGPRRRARPPARTDAPRSRSSSCSGSRRAPAAPRAQPRRSSTTTARRELDGARAARAPDPVGPRPLPLLHGMHAGVAAALPRPRGGDGRRRAARAEPVLGRRARPSSTPDDVARWTRRRTLSAARLAARGRARASASASARSPRSRPAIRTRAALGRARERLGAEARRARAARSSGRRGSRTRPCSSSSGARRRSASPSSSRSPTARRSGSSSACSTRSRSTPRSTRGCAARSRTRRCSSSSPGLPKRARLRHASPPSGSTRRSSFLRECLDEAIAGGAEARLELTDLQRNELEQGLWRDLEALVRDEAESELPLVPRRFEVSFGSERSAPELQRGLDLGRLPALGQDRPHRPRPVQPRAGSSRTTSRAQEPTPRPRSSASCGCRSRSTCSSSATSSASSRSAGYTARSPATARRAGSCAPTRARTGSPATPGERLRLRGRLLGQGGEGARTPRARSSSGSARATSATTRAKAPARPGASLADVPDQEGMSGTTVATRPPNPEQLAAIEAPGLVFVSAGAGTGKTTVLVERFVRAVDARRRRRARSS